MSDSVSFKDQFRDLQYLVKELVDVRKHNLAYKEGDPDNRLVFAEAALVLTTFERFLRAVLGEEATERDTLPNLLEKATSSRLGLLELLHWKEGKPLDRLLAIKQITSIRNTLLHGNYEQAAEAAGCASKEEYFKTQFLPEIEAIYGILDKSMAQIDIITGRPHQSRD